MSLILFQPATAGPIGPGYAIGIQNTVGPVPNDDYAVCEIRDAATTAQLCFMNAQCNGSLFVFELMGVRAAPIPPDNDFGSWDASRNAGGAYGPATAGRPVQVNIRWRHSSNVIVAFATPPGAWTWDPVGGLGELMIRLTAQNMSSSQLTRIERAVYRQFPDN